MLLLLFASALAVAAAGPTSRIVSGNEATPGSWPSQLSLQLDNSHICGAVVLNPRYALTAAHCVDFDGYAVTRFRVVCGAHNIIAQESTQQASVAARILKHPSYNPNSSGFPNDIALIELANPLDLSSARCQPANLPPSDNKDYADKDSYITGWGRLSGGGATATVLKEAPIRTISHSQCRSLWGGIFSPVRTTNICVYDANHVYGACNGDSGGPLYAPDFSTGREKVVGVTSFGRSGCDVRYPSVYTRVSSYLDWINSNMQ